MPLHFWVKWNKFFELGWDCPQCFNEDMGGFILMYFTVNAVVVNDFYKVCFYPHATESITEESARVEKSVRRTVTCRTLLTDKEDSCHMVFGFVFHLIINMTMCFQRQQELHTMKKIQKYVDM
jgi:hypothetical protein